MIIRIFNLVISIDQIKNLKLLKALSEDDLRLMRFNSIPQSSLRLALHDAVNKGWFDNKVVKVNNETIGIKK